MIKRYVPLFPLEEVSKSEFKSPAPGNLSPAKAAKLKDIYQGCRKGSVDKDPSKKEDPKNKELCARVAWSRVKK